MALLPAAVDAPLCTGLSMGSGGRLAASLPPMVIGWLLLRPEPDELSAAIAASASLLRRVDPERWRASGLAPPSSDQVASGLAPSGDTPAGRGEALGVARASAAAATLPPAPPSRLTSD